MSKNKFFITFGVSRAFRKQYVLLEIDKSSDGNPMGIAREAAMDHFGRVWGFIYPEEDLKRQIKEYDLQYFFTIHIDLFGRYRLEK